MAGVGPRDAVKASDHRAIRADGSAGRALGPPDFAAAPADEINTMPDLPMAPATNSFGVDAAGYNTELD